MGLYHPAKNVLVEVHWALVSPGYTFSPATRIVWESVQSVSIAGRSIKTFSSENQLLCSCLQQAKHNWWRLGWLMDLAALIRQSPAMDWQQIENRAGSFGTARMIRVSLRLVQRLFEVTLPGSIAEWVENDVCSIKIAERILKHLLLVDITAKQPTPLDPLFRASMESFVDRAFYWFDNVLCPTPLEWALLPLPDRLYALYYPIRVGRLVCKHTAGRLLARRMPLRSRLINAVATACLPRRSSPRRPKAGGASASSERMFWTAFSRGKPRQNEAATGPPFPPRIYGLSSRRLRFLERASLNWERYFGLGAEGKSGRTLQNVAVMVYTDYRLRLGVRRCSAAFVAHSSTTGIKSSFTLCASILNL